MSQNELKNLAKIIRNGWKELATNDQSDADQMVEVIKQILEELETLEAAE